MKSSPLASYALLGLVGLALLSVGGCAAVAGIFKAGMWVGIVMAVVVLGAGLLIFSRLR